MELIFLGTAGGMPTLERNVSGVALRRGREWSLFDCGEGTQHQLLRTPLSPNRLSRIFISHLHGDHVYGLFGLLGSRSMSGITTPLHIVGPRGLRALVDSVCEASSMHLKFELYVQEIEDTGGAVALRLGNVAGADALLGGAQPGQVIRLDRFDDGPTPRRSYLGPLTLARLMAQLCHGALAGRLPPVLNLCAWEAVEMAALLDTAGLPWEPVPEPETALAELTLSADLLAAHIEVPEGAGRAETVIAEWRQVRP